MIMLHMDFNAATLPRRSISINAPLNMKSICSMYPNQLNPWFTAKDVFNIKQKNLKQHLTKHQHYIVTVNHLIHPITTHNIEMSSEEPLKSKMTNI